MKTNIDIYDDLLDKEKRIAKMAKLINRLTTIVMEHDTMLKKREVTKP